MTLSQFTILCYCGSMHANNLYMFIVNALILALISKINFTYYAFAAIQRLFLFCWYQATGDQG